MSITREEAHALAMAHWKLFQWIGRKYGRDARRAEPDADDLAQVAYIAFFEAALAYDEPGNVVPIAVTRAKWGVLLEIPRLRYPLALYRVAIMKGTPGVEVAMRGYADPENLDRVPAPEPPDPDQPSEPTPGERLTPLLGLLSFRQRQAITMLFGLEGEPRTQAQIGRELGISRTLVGRYLKRALPYLKGERRRRKEDLVWCDREHPNASQRRV